MTRITPPRPQRSTIDVGLILAMSSDGGAVLATRDNQWQTTNRQATLQALRTRPRWYALCPVTEVRQRTGSINWQVERWRNKTAVLRPVCGGTVVTPLHTADLDPHHPDEVFDFFDVLWAEYNCKPGGILAMTSRLWRQHLPSNGVTAGGPYTPSAAATYGGRVEHWWTGQLADVNIIDLAAAYPTAMATEPIYPILERVDTVLPVEPVQGICHATVTVDDPGVFDRTFVGPLPFKVFQSGATSHTCYGWGMPFTAWWPTRELQTAAAAGVDVTIHEQWQAGGTPLAFDQWWPTVQPLRRLPGNAGRLGKRLTSAAWGMFAGGVGVRSVVGWVDEKTEITISSQTVRRPTVGLQHVAAEITARVRGKLYDMLTTLPTPTWCHTDAVAAPANFPTAPGWVVKSSMPIIEIRGGNQYRYQCASPACYEWHYSFAGAPSDLAGWLWENGGVATLPDGSVQLPAQHLAQFVTRAMADADPEGYPYRPSTRRRPQQLVSAP